MIEELDETELEAAAQKMAEMLSSDSMIPIEESRHRIRCALILDGLVPSLYEMECLVYGGPLESEIDDFHPDTDGEGNPEVDALFPLTNAAIAAFF